MSGADTITLQGREHLPVTRPLTDADMSWELSPAPDDNTREDLVVDLAIEAQSYRTLAQEAIHALRSMQQRYTRQQTAYHRALDELKRLRKNSDSSDGVQRAAPRERAA